MKTVAALGLMLGGVYGDDEAEVYKKLCKIVEKWIEIYEQDGERLLPETAIKNILENPI